MSKLKVAALQGLSASSDAITLANDGTCTANITNNLINRRLTINGDMRIAQRGTSSTSSGYHTIDRFASGSGNIGQNVTQSQQSLSSSDAPYALGFRKYKRVQLAAAGNANANAYVESAIYVPEAQDLASSGWDYTSSSSYVTLQFWFRCSTNQPFYTAIRMDDGTARIFSFSFTASGNNTWTKVTKNIPGNSGITINNDNGIGMSIFIIPYYGTNLTADGTALDTWNTYGSGTTHFPDMASTWLTAGASTFDLTGVQLEVSDYATSFEFLSFADELRRCERYYQDSFEYHHINASNGESDRWIRFRTEMRASPTVTTSPTNSVSFGVHVTTSNGFSGDGSGNSHANFNLGWTASAEL